MATLRRHPQAALWMAALLGSLALWAILPSPFVREARAASPLETKVDELLTQTGLLQDAIDAGQLDATRVPRSWIELPSAATERFELVLAVDDGSGGSHYVAVLDHRTGLVWARAPVASGTYREAVLAALRSSLGGVGGWRLPSLAEFASIMEDSDDDGEADQLDADFPWGPAGTANPPKPDGEFWTSDRLAVSDHSFVTDGGSGNQFKVFGHFATFIWENSTSPVDVGIGLFDDVERIDGSDRLAGEALAWHVLGPR